MIQRGINPNCSEIVVRLGDLDRSSSIEDVRAEIEDILSCTNVMLAGEITVYKDNRDGRISFKQDMGSGDLIYARDEDGYRGLQSRYMPPSDKDHPLVRDLEMGHGWVSVILYLPGSGPVEKWYRDSVSITYSGFGSEMVLMISDSDMGQYPIIAQVIRAMDYVWTPHDGGHDNGFNDWCLNNGYADVIDKRW